MGLQLTDAIEWGEGNARNSGLVYTYIIDLADLIAIRDPRGESQGLLLFLSSQGKGGE